MERTKLNKTLYIAASLCLGKQFRNDTEAVKTKRDAVCEQMFGTDYRKLTESQLVDVINKLQIQSGYTAPEMVREPRASNNQIKLLRYYAIRCALEFADFDEIELKNNFTGEVLTGWDLKFTALKLFETKRLLPGTLFYAVHKNWINPKMHTFLIEGGFKKFAKNYEKFHYDYLKPEEAQYLIKRFGQMFQNITNIYLPADIHEIINAN